MDGAAAGEAAGRLFESARVDPRQGDLMHSGDVRIQEIRSKARGERVVISGLDSTIKDPSVKQLLQRASFSLDDVEFLVRNALQAQNPDYVSMWLSAAETAVEIAALQRKLVQDIIAKYGPKVQSIPAS